MKRINPFLFTLFIIIVIGFISCNAPFEGCKKMPKQITGTGEIISNARIGFSELDYSGRTPKEVVITSDSLNIYNALVSFDEGATYNPIDFSKYTVLAHNTNGGCYSVFERNVTKNIEKQKYIYKIKVISCGTCQRNWGSENWVLIPKIEDNYTVEFVVEEEWRGKW